MNKLCSFYLVLSSLGIIYPPERVPDISVRESCHVHKNCVFIGSHISICLKDPVFVVNKVQ